MNSTALVFMLSIWGVIAFFTLKFFIKVVRTPPRDDAE
jgi:hypothetical protein